ncbi:SH3 domain-containing protein, partial [Desulfovibrio sp. OttesenSCG-928-M16]|nr:SH3 domain-containing protein [Desulfovibrio sp. OttesenSCG-928-M16]
MPMRTRHFLLILCLAASLALSACGGKSAAPYAPYNGPPAMDVLTLPQDLTVYAGSAGGSEALAPMSAQLAAADRQKDAFFRPWRLDKPGHWIKKSLEANFNMRPDKAFTDGKRPFPQDVWDEMVANSNKKAWGKGAGPGITLRHSNLRAMPGSIRYYLRPDLPGEGYPFDYFQHTSIAPGTPVYICNVSKDGLWLLVDSPATAGWLPSGDVAGVDESFMSRWQARPLAALTRDKVSLGESRAHIGALLPLGENGGLYVPVRAASGQAAISEEHLPPDAFAPVPMVLSANNVARIGNDMMAQPYGWGGLDEKRDCSALTRDLLAPFGIYLPRNSGNQAKKGRVLPLAGLSNQ